MRYKYGFLLLIVIIGGGYYHFATSSVAIQAMDAPYHHLADGRFRNLPGSPAREANYKDFLTFFWKRLRARNSSPEIPHGHILEKHDVFNQLTAHQNNNSLTWLGHSSFLISLNGKNILTDPYLTQTAGIGPIGPKRYVPPGLAIEELPKIDVIVISHSHYDHLDITTLKQLPNKDHTQVIVPLHLGKLIKRAGFIHVHEKDWHDKVVIDDLTITVLPVIHWSRRTLFDMNKTLWAGYHIATTQSSLVFSGDTAYGEMFATLGEEYGPVDYALLPIGAYEPKKIMSASHTNPEQAVQLAQAIQANTLVGMHWGTIVLSEEPAFEPPIRFRQAALEAGFIEDNIWILAIGETRAL